MGQGRQHPCAACESRRVNAEKRADNGMAERRAKTARETGRKNQALTLHRINSSIRRVAHYLSEYPRADSGPIARGPQKDSFGQRHAARGYEQDGGSHAKARAGRTAPDTMSARAPTGCRSKANGW